MRPLEGIFTDVPWLGVALFQVTLIAGLGCLGWLSARRLGPAWRGGILLANLVGVLLVPAISDVSPVWVPMPAPPVLSTVDAEAVLGFVNQPWDPPSYDAEPAQVYDVGAGVEARSDKVVARSPDR